MRGAVRAGGLDARPAFHDRDRLTAGIVAELPTFHIIMTHMAWVRSLISLEIA
jgi:hypothetical protein